jgi:hypothetical protein
MRILLRTQLKIYNNFTVISFLFLPLNMDAIRGALKPCSTDGSLKFPMVQAELTTRTTKWQSAEKRHSIWQGVGTDRPVKPPTVLFLSVIINMITIKTKMNKN